MTINNTQVELPLNEIWDDFSQIGGTFATDISTLPSKLQAAMQSPALKSLMRQFIAAATVQQRLDLIEHRELLMEAM